MDKCPVCKSELEDGLTNCRVCGFAELNMEFINVEDANNWENTVVKQCRNIYNAMSKKTGIDEGGPTVPFDKPRLGCNVIIRDRVNADIICGKLVEVNRYAIQVKIPGKLKTISFDLQELLNSESIAYCFDEIFKNRIEREEERREWSKKFREKLKNGEPFRESYDRFIMEHRNSSVWRFDEPIIYRHGGRGQYVNTYFCQYDNPPIEIMNHVAKKEGNKYELRIGVKNLSNETRNQPIKFRYRILTPLMDTVVDCVDDVTPAPQYQYLTIKFEDSGNDKPIFEIIG